MVLLAAAHGPAPQPTRGTAAQRDAVLATIVNRPVPLREGIGTAHEVVTTLSPRAQAYYDQGLTYLHSYVWIEAARSFNQALSLDGDLAMAYVGLSYALGELGMPSQARDASRRASALAARTTDREQFRIDVRAKQLEASARPDEHRRLTDYEAELDRAVAAYPNDIELLLLRGQAASPTRDAHGMASGSGSLAYYERALAQSPEYFAPHHYLTHAYENIGRWDRALEHAAVYASMATRIPHAHHMHGHVLRRVGRTADAIAEFRRADELEVAYLEAEQIPAECDWHYHHNLDLLATTYEYTGQMRLAERPLRQSFELPAAEVAEQLNETAWPMFLLAWGRMDEAMAASRALVAREPPLVQAIGHVMVSRLLMHRGEMGPAGSEADAALAVMRSIGPIGGVVVPELQLTQGELLLRLGQRASGRALLHDGISKLRARSGPDVWLQTVFSLERLFQVALDLGDWALAAAVADEMGELAPAYAGAHYAAGKVADHAVDRVHARQEYAQAIDAWRDADPDLRVLIDARQRLAALSQARARPLRH